jgi:hypothetical protein
MFDPSPKVVEGWTGPGRQDARITPLKLEEDGLHIDTRQRGMYEWWYFDAHLDSDHILVVFFHASNPNPGLQGKTGVEVVLIDPDGKRKQKFYAHPKSEFTASRDRPEVKIGGNTLRVDQSNRALPTYEIDINEYDFACHLRYTGEVNGWKPGTGFSHFADLGFFAWIVPFARAHVEGTITVRDKSIQVTGIGYHDHNWLNFQFQKIIDYWMWGRIYSQSFTLAYAYIQCNDRVDHHAVKVLMLADGQEIVLSTGEFDFGYQRLEYNSQAGYQFPGRTIISAPPELKVTLDVSKVLEAQDMLENYHPLVRFLAKNILRLKPGYFRLVSNFKLEVDRGAGILKESGATLHEIVLFKPVE